MANEYLLPSDYDCTFSKTGGTGTLIAGNPIGLKYGITQSNSTRLPLLYQEVEYLEVNGTQYIDSEITSLTAPYEIEFQYYKNTITINNVSIFGCGDLGKIVNIYNGYYETLFGNTGTNTAIAQVDAIIKVKSGDGVYLNDNKILTTLNNASRSSSNSALFFAFRESTGDMTPKYYFNGRMYYYKIKENNKITHDFIPCYRKSDSKPGLYDIITNSFYPTVTMFADADADATYGNDVISNRQKSFTECLKYGNSIQIQDTSKNKVQMVGYNYIESDYDSSVMAYELGNGDPSKQATLGLGRNLSDGLMFSSDFFYYPSMQISTSAYTTNTLEFYNVDYFDYGLNYPTNAGGSYTALSSNNIEITRGNVYLAVYKFMDWNFDIDIANRRFFGGAYKIGGSTNEYNIFKSPNYLVRENTKNNTVMVYQWLTTEDTNFGDEENLQLGCLYLNDSLANNFTEKDKIKYVLLFNLTDLEATEKSLNEIPLIFTENKMDRIAFGRRTSNLSAKIYEVGDDDNTAKREILSDTYDVIFYPRVGCHLKVVGGNTTGYTTVNKYALPKYIIVTSAGTSYKKIFERDNIYYSDTPIDLTRTYGENHFIEDEEINKVKILDENNNLVSNELNEKDRSYCISKPKAAIKETQYPTTDEDNYAPGPLNQQYSTGTNTKLKPYKNAVLIGNSGDIYSSRLCENTFKELTTTQKLAVRNFTPILEIDSNYCLKVSNISELIANANIDPNMLVVRLIRRHSTRFSNIEYNNKSTSGSLSVLNNNDSRNLGSVVVKDTLNLVRDLKNGIMLSDSHSIDKNGRVASSLISTIRSIAPSKTAFRHGTAHNGSNDKVENRSKRNTELFHKHDYFGIVIGFKSLTKTGKVTDLFSQYSPREITDFEQYCSNISPKAIDKNYLTNNLRLGAKWNFLSGDNYNDDDSNIDDFSPLKYDVQFPDFTQSYVQGSATTYDELIENFDPILDIDQTTGDFKILNWDNYKAEIERLGYDSTYAAAYIVEKKARRKDCTKNSSTFIIRAAQISNSCLYYEPNGKYPGKSFLNFNNKNANINSDGVLVGSMEIINDRRLSKKSFNKRFDIFRTNRNGSHYRVGDNHYHMYFGVSLGMDYWGTQHIDDLIQAKNYGRDSTDELSRQMFKFTKYSHNWLDKCFLSYDTSYYTESNFSREKTKLVGSPYFQMIPKEDANPTIEYDQFLNSFVPDVNRDEITGDLKVLNWKEFTEKLVELGINPNYATAYIVEKKSTRSTRKADKDSLGLGYDARKDNPKKFVIRATQLGNLTDDGSEDPFGVTHYGSDINDASKFTNFNKYHKNITNDGVLVGSLNIIKGRRLARRYFKERLEPSTGNILGETHRHMYFSVVVGIDPYGENKEYNKLLLTGNLSFMTSNPSLYANTFKFSRYGNNWIDKEFYYSDTANEALTEINYNETFNMVRYPYYSAPNAINLYKSYLSTFVPHITLSGTGQNIKITNWKEFKLKLSLCGINPDYATAYIVEKKPVAEYTSVASPYKEAFDKSLAGNLFVIHANQLGHNANDITNIDGQIYSGMDENHSYQNFNKYHNNISNDGILSDSGNIILGRRLSKKNFNERYVFDSNYENGIPTGEVHRHLYFGVVVGIDPFGIDSEYTTAIQNKNTQYFYDNKEYISNAITFSRYSNEWVDKEFYGSDTLGGFGVESDCNKTLTLRDAPYYKYGNVIPVEKEPIVAPSVDTQTYVMGSATTYEELIDQFDPIVTMDETTNDLVVTNFNNFKIELERLGMNSNIATAYIVEKKPHKKCDYYDSMNPTTKKNSTIYVVRSRQNHNVSMMDYFTYKTGATIDFVNFNSYHENIENGRLIGSGNIIKGRRFSQRTQNDKYDENGVKIQYLSKQHLYFSACLGIDYYGLPDYDPSNFGSTYKNNCIFTKYGSKWIDKTLRDSTNAIDDTDIENPETDNNPPLRLVSKPFFLENKEN